MKIDFDQVRADASGKWLSIWRNLGIEVNETGKHGPCPACGGLDRFRVDRDVDEKGSYFCSGCKSGFGFDLIMKVMQIDIKEAMEAVHGIVGKCQIGVVPKETTASPEILRKIFMESKPISDVDVAGKYLLSRGLKAIPRCLRHHPKCWESETKKNQHAMLAIFHSADNVALTMHRTYLTPDSDKIRIKSPKKILPSLKKMTGGAVRLFPFTSGALGIAEGIETAIAAHEYLKIPVWAALSSVLLEGFVPPEKVDTLIIISDNDANFAGQKAAFSLANRLSLKEIDVKVYVPEKIGNDWLDVLLSRERDK